MVFGLPGEDGTNTQEMKEQFMGKQRLWSEVF